MKRILSLAIPLLGCIHAAAQEYNTRLIPYRKGDKWGYSDAAKNIIIQPRFREASLFIGTLASVKDTGYCVINERGNVVYRHKSAISIVNGGQHFITWDDPHTRQMFDTAGKPVSKVYNSIYGFNKYGYASITAGYVKQGLLDQSFREVIPPKYGSIEFFSKDLVKVYDERLKKYGLVNLKTGKQFATEYSMIYPPRDGLMMVRQGNTYGFINMKGKKVIPVKYQKEIPHEERRGEDYNESTYEQFNFDGFYGGLAAVVQQGKAGYIDKKGKTAIPFEFDKAYGFNGNYAWVQKDGKWGMINKQGQYVLKPEYRSPAVLYAKELTVLDGFHEGLIPVKKDSLYGYVDTTGTVIIPFRYRRAEPFYDGLAAAYLHERVAFINRQDEVVIPARYIWVEGVGIAYQNPLENGRGIASNDDNSWSIIDKTGAELMPLRFVGDRIYFENGLADGKAAGKRYIFTEKGDIVHTFENDNIVTQYTPDLYFNYGDDCYINIKTKVKYCE